MRQLSWPPIMLAIATLTWSGNFVIGRAFRAEFDPIALTTWRWVIALAVLLPFAAGDVWRYRHAILSRPAWLVALGLTGICVFHLTVYIGLSLAEAITGSLVMSTGPVLIALLVWMAYGDRVSLVYGVGVAVSLIGAVFVIARGDVEVLLQLDDDMVGGLWMLGASLTWAAYSVLLRHRPQGVPPLALLTASIVVGLTALIPLHLVAVGPTLGFVPSTEAFLVLAYVSIAASVIAYICWNSGVHGWGPSRAGVFLHLMPVYSAILAILFIGEQIAAYHWIGGSLILVGIIAATVRPTERNAT